MTSTQSRLSPLHPLVIILIMMIIIYIYQVLIKDAVIILVIILSILKVITLLRGSSEDDHAKCLIYHEDDQHDHVRSMVQGDHVVVGQVMPATSRMRRGPRYGVSNLKRSATENRVGNFLRENQPSTFKKRWRMP